MSNCKDSKSACLRFGAMSDIHLYRKPYRLVSALRMLREIDVLLLAGDLADRGTAEQYAILESVLETHLKDIPIFIVSGNHDLQLNDDENFRMFERKIRDRLMDRYQVDDDPSGAYSVRLNEYVDLVGLNPLYTQKIFRFSDRGRQLAYLEDCLKNSPCPNHIVLCHPPLAAHNPQQSRPYLPKEQDAKLQQIIHEHPHTLFLSGHTHLYPTIEYDGYGNIYINDGSICPTQKKETGDNVDSGNVMFFEVTNSFVNPRFEMIKNSAKTVRSVEK